MAGEIIPTSAAKLPNTLEKSLPKPEDRAVNIAEYNRNAWNLQSLEGCRWSTPFDDAVFDAAKAGQLELILTPNRKVPTDWFPPLKDVDVLALASGGGQQVPQLAAAGARVTSFDASDIQLEKDMETAERHGLTISIEQGDMADLSTFDDESFDLVFHPVSNVFAAAVQPVWRECARILRPGGRLLCGFMNPCFFLFDHEKAEATGELVVKYALPYSCLESLDEEELENQLEAQLSIEFSHSLEDQIGGQTDAGLVITALYEDTWDDESTALNPWMPTFIATRAEKPKS
jgi:SAM-dependent methyltransferase